MSTLLIVIANIIMAIEIIKLNNEIAYLEYKINTYELLKKGEEKWNMMQIIMKNIKIV